MAYSWIEAYCLAKTGTVREYKAEWEATRYMLAGKMYAMVGGDKDNRPIITLKCEPETGFALREQHEDIVEGYYMNKVHWNSVYLDKAAPAAVIKSMIDMSYELILGALSKKKRQELLAGANGPNQ